MIAGAKLPGNPRYTYYGLRVERIVGDHSWALVSPATGPFVADFCPEFDVSKYEPRPGYVLCKLSYTDRGCMDVSRQRDGFWWVKDQHGYTATLNENDTFKPWPKCQKDEPKEALNAIP